MYAFGLFWIPYRIHCCMNEFDYLISIYKGGLYYEAEKENELVVVFFQFIFLSY